MKQYYDLLDGLRAYAVLAVLVSHWIFIRPVQEMGLGFLGVNLFFVISGFLITEILLNDINEKKRNGAILKKFYWRRTLRIFPIYYISLFVLMLLNYQDSANVFWYNITYTTNIYNYSTGDVTKGFAHLWSLCAEEQFYLLWPFILLVSKRHAFKVIIVLIAASLITRLCFWYFQPHHYHIFNYRMTPACLDVFGLGAIMAYLKIYYKEQLLRYLKLWLLPLVSFITYCTNAFYLHYPFIEEVLNRLLVGIISVYLIGWSIYHAKGLKNILQYTWLKYIGRISYGVYLYHLFVSTSLAPIIESYLGSLDYSFLPALKYNIYILTAPLYTLITILLATASYYLIEVPFLRLKTRFS